jgi:hypothetical protein
MNTGKFNRPPHTDWLELTPEHLAGICEDWSLYHAPTTPISPMVSVTAASELLTATSVVIESTIFAWERVEAPKKKRARGMLFVWFCLIFWTLLGCLHAVVYPEGIAARALDAKIWFNGATVLTGSFPLILITLLFPEAVAKFLE